ncbi:MAG: hypothetical protein H8E60_08680 [Candidatus Marinimicrobia bacterium]|nr:hypothetical protein [Candidatus Neomarinimicrobiota bacterium]
MINKLTNILPGIDKITKSGSSKLVINLAIKNILGDVGKVTDLLIDRKNNKITCSIKLKGEVESIDIKIDKYEILKNDNEVTLKILDFQSNKEWMKSLLTKKNSFNLPREIDNFF